MRRCFLLFLILVWASPLAAGELAGISMPDTMSVNGKNLVLNGMGLRKKAIIKVYVAGLYLPAKETSASKILGGDTERSLTMQFTRGVDKQKICEAWHEGLAKNSADKAASQKANFDTLCGYMEDMSSGGKINFTYVPGQGTTVSTNGSSKGTIPGKDFADAMFACWIGSNPPGEDFKAGLLGTASE